MMPDHTDAVPVDGSPAATLQRADEASRRECTLADAGSPTLPCESALAWIELELTDENGFAVADQPFRVVAPDQKAFSGSTDVYGCARIDGLTPGACLICFTRLDGASWNISEPGQAEPAVDIASGSHPAQPGDGATILASKYGLTAQRLWDANAALQPSRPYRDVLKPGDNIVIDKLHPKSLSRPTGQRHCFIRAGTKAQFRLRILAMGEPDAADWQLDIDGRLQPAQQQSSGWIEAAVRPEISEIKLLKAGRVQCSMAIGHLDPVNEKSGQIARLRNLDFYYSRGNADQTLEAALRAFQFHAGLRVNGKPDKDTLDALVASYGC